VGHVGLYGADIGRIEMHLRAAWPQDVTIDGAVHHFETGERIHTENSYKYAPGDFDAVARCRRTRTPR
jgi:uncharacterized SAM-dependent methyltransferase